MGVVDSGFQERRFYICMCFRNPAVHTCLMVEGVINPILQSLNDLAVVLPSIWINGAISWHKLRFATSALFF